MKEAFFTDHALADLLMDLQVAMQNGDVWDCEKPTQEARRSVEPFCIDTMTFDQWLRFVMIERFMFLLVSGGELPARCHIVPMAEEAFKMKPKPIVSSIVNCLDRIDQHLSGAL